MNSAVPRAFSNHAGRDSDPDTHPGSPFWKKAPVTVMSANQYGKHIPTYRTEVRSRWTSGNLYFLFVCPYEELHLKPGPNLATKTNELWLWDVAEVFVGSTTGLVHRYREFEVSPQGEWLDFDINLEMPDKLNNPGWISGFEKSARIEAHEKIWYAWMRIPYESIEDGEASPGKLLRINFYRSQGPNHIEIAWQPTMNESFHRPEKFGLLELIP